MKKSFVKFMLENKSLRCRQASPDEMFILGFFLTSDVGCVGSSFKEWIIDNNFPNEAASNTTFLEKAGNYIILSDQYSELEDGGPFLKISRNELVKILDAWEQFCKTKPKEITITKENDDTFTIEAKD